MPHKNTTADENKPAKPAKKKKKKMDEEFECEDTMKTAEKCVKNPVKCMREFSPINMLFREEVDECILLKTYDALVCINDTCNCCCDIKMDDVVNSARMAKFFWNHFV